MAGEIVAILTHSLERSAPLISSGETSSTGGAKLLSPVPSAA